MDEQLKTILIIIVSVSIFGLIVFVMVKNYIKNKINYLVEKEVSLVSSIFYQKLFVFLISFSTILIFPESPNELENICESYNSRKICSVW